MRFTPTRALSFYLALSIACGPVAHTQASDLPPLKRLGRGIGDRQTGAKLQLACVGENKIETGERGCELLQFLHTDVGGYESLIGPIIDLSRSRTRTKTILHEELRCYGLFRHVNTGRFFTFSAMAFGNIGKGRKSQCTDPIYSPLSAAELRDKNDRREKKLYRRNSILAPVFVVGGASTLLFLLVSGTVSGGAVALFVPGVYASLFVADAATYPFRLLFQGPGGPLGSTRKNVDSFEARAKYAWQLKPKHFPHRRFESLVTRLQLLGDRDELRETMAIDSTPETSPEEWSEVHPESTFMPIDLESDDE